MIRIRGATVEERNLARRQREAQNRAATAQQRIGAAPTGYQKLYLTCNYAQAVGKNMLDDQGCRDLAQAIVRLVNERNKP